MTMQLLLNATSPFARLARVVALEKHLQGRLQLVWCDPWSDDPVLLGQHPQGRIPVLVTDAGDALSESLLIAQYLDHHGHGTALVPVARMAPILAATGVAYGLMETAFTHVMQRKHRGAEADGDTLGQRRQAAIDRALQHLACHTVGAAAPDAPTTLDQLATAVALEYLLFRLPGYAQHPALVPLQPWLGQMRLRPSLQHTAFA